MGGKALDTSVGIEASRAGDRSTAETVHPVRAARGVGGYLVALLVAAFVVRALGAPWPHFPRSFPDSFSFSKVARLGPFHPSFYFDERPIGFPLLAWVVGRSPTLLVTAQTLLYAGAFVVLGRVLLRALTSRAIAVGTIVFVGAIAVESRNALWNTLYLSESLSSTCAVLTIAAWLHAAARPSDRTIRIAWFATLAWVLVRDTNVIPVMLVVVPTACVVALLARHRGGDIARALVVGAVGIACVCSYVYISQYTSHRNIYPVFNNVGTRVLPDPSLTRWFVAHGMPMDAAVRGRTGHFTWDDGEAFLRDPALAKMRSWVRGPGGRVLFTSFVLRAPDWWHRLHAELPHALSYRLDDYDSFHVAKRLPRTLPPPFGEPRTTGGLVAGLALATAGIAVTAADRRRRVLATFAAVGLVSALVDVYVSFAGDSLEVERHLVGPLLRLALAIVIGVALGADTALNRWREHRSARREVARP